MSATHRELHEVAQLIGQFYLAKNGGNYAATEDELLVLQIHQLELVGEKIIFHTARPGLLIGPRGENVDKLAEFIGKSIHIIEVKHSPFDLMKPEDPDAHWLEYDYELADYPDIEEDGGLR